MKNILIVMMIFLPIMGCNYETAKVDGVINGYSLPGSLVIAKTIHNEIVGRATAGSDGRYAMTLKEVLPQALNMESAGGEYYEVGAEFPTRLDGEIKRHGKLNYINGKDNYLSFTYLGTISSGLADYYVANGSSLENALIAANKVISNWTGVDVENSVIYKVNGKITEAGLGKNEDEMLATFIEAGLSTLAAEINRRNEVGVNEGIKSHEIITMVYEDIKHDGIINGITSTRVNAAGMVTLDGNLVRHQHSLAIADFVYSSYNTTAITAIELASRITRINGADSEIFNGLKAINIPEDRPYLKVGGLVDKGVVSGEVLLDITSYDYQGVRSISISFDGNVVEIDPTARSYVLDATIYKNEDYQVRMIAENFMGRKTELIIDVAVQNNPSELGNQNPSDDELVAGLITLSAEIPEPFGIDKVQFFIDGGLVAEFEDVISVVDFEYDTNQLENGSHNFRVNIISNSGNIAYKTTIFETDNTPSNISWELPAQKILDLQQDFSVSVEDDQLLKSLKFFLDGSLIKDYEGVSGQSVYSTSFTLDVRSIYEGTHKMAFESVNQAGQVTRIEKEFFVDWANPYINIITPSGVNLYETETFTFQADDSNGLKEGKTTVVNVQGMEPFSIDSTLREFTLTNSDSLRSELLLEVTVEDIVGRTSTDSILVKYNSLSLSQPTRSISGSRVTYTFTIQGLSSEFYTVDLQAIAPTTQRMMDDQGLSTSKRYTNGVGTYSFTYTKINPNPILDCDYRSMDYSLTVRHKGLSSAERIMKTNDTDYISLVGC